MAVAIPTPTHESYIAAIRDLAVDSAVSRGTINAEEAERLRHTRLIYGVGDPGIRGACYYQSWQNGVGTVDVIEVCAMSQESWVQLTGTTLHEMAHVLAGASAGHDTSWKAACVRLGFTKRPEAAGQTYHLALFQERIRHRAYALARLMADGSPAFRNSSWLMTGMGAFSIRPCSAGIGTRGGKSRGKGSGSRLRPYECACTKPIKVRVASDSFAAHCDLCESPFVKVS